MTVILQFYQWTYHPDRRSIKKLALNDTLDQIDLTDIYRAFLLKATEYTVFPSGLGTFSRIHMLGHKLSLGKCNKIEIVSRIFLTIML